jgi:hypothetical protein
MAATTNAPPNAETANPTGPKGQPLPPKSYAEAVEVDLPVGDETSTNGSVETNGAHEEQVNYTSNGVQVLRINTLALESGKKEGNPEKSRSADGIEEYSATVNSTLFLRSQQLLMLVGS